jgi:hypothetical protein
MKLTVLLGASGEASFDITLNDNSFVQKWTEELRWCLDNCEFNQQEAFASVNTIEESEKILLQSCETINRYLKNFIEIRTNIKDQQQEYFNYLHSKFEKLSGNYGLPTRLFSLANIELRTAIRNLNNFVHLVEDKTDQSPNFYISFNKDQYRRQTLIDSDYDFFEFNSPAGTLFLHYVELGKEYIDLYEDNLPIDYVGAKNLHYYSGEAFLMFNKFDAFADKNYSNWLQSNGIDQYNKKLGHGKIPLGIVDNTQDAISKIKQHRHIASILIKE